MKRRAIRTVATDGAPAPSGHYAQATVAGGLLFISGQLPFRPGGGALADASFEVQASQALANLLAILYAAGSAPELLARVTVYVVDIRHWAKFDAIFAEMVPPARPARAVVPVPELHHGFLIEIEAIALAKEP
jgi:2-iminobutanoate/2-iminopropanoate deaminase